ncbi:MAG: hypothetical protein CBB96_05480 [Gammaproteobacteria bacterium TMED36]|nr:MAG: hypothetical protein CBB96_09000 [Gammaproteobacteria bacterium TMED36]OUT94614.1 MAG: hypothetical protein CBB96_05480 [Gammaproteobacteria bacterium TMED36]|tara:strand:- start:5261 stop:5716 length:456 start_codon:yes stop_codon:yes gene_type:complete
MIALRQFKLTSGDEIITEVVDFADSDHSLVIRNTLKIVSMENMMSGQRFFAFRPWVLYQGDHTHVQILNPNNIVCETTPSKDLIVEFKKNLDLFQDHELSNIDQTRKEMEKYFKEKVGVEVNIDDLAAECDSDGGKIIKGPWIYPGSDTLN